MINLTVALFSDVFQPQAEEGLPLSTNYGELEALSVQDDRRLVKPQQFFNRHVHAERLQELMGHLEAAPEGADKWARLAHLRSIRLEGARLVLDALPCERKLRLTNDDFRIWVQQLLSLPLVGLIPKVLQGQTCCYSTRRQADNLIEPYHMSVCEYNPQAIIERHTTLVQEVAHLLSVAGMPCEIEPRYCGTTGQKGPDVYVTINGEDYALDVTTAVVQQVADLRQAAELDYCRVLAAEERKRVAYSAELDQVHGRRLLTLCFESTGTMGPQFQRFWNILARHIRDKQPEGLTWPRTWAAASYVTYAKQRMAVVYATQTCRVLHKRVLQKMREYDGAFAGPC